jgi:AraC-like DNA-binding protein
VILLDPSRGEPVHFARREEPWSLAAPVVAHWGPIGTARLRLPSSTIPLGKNVTHFVGLNLGRDGGFEISDRSSDWLSTRPPSGSLNVFPADYECSFRLGPANDCFGVSVGTEFAGHVVGVEASRLIRPAIGVDDRVAVNVVKAIMAEAQAPTPGTSRRIERLAAVLLSCLAERPVGGDVLLRSGQEMASAKLRRVLAFIEDHLDEPIRVAGLARLAGLSVSGLYNTFRRAVGRTPHRYVVSLRIGRAKELLRRGERTITDIAIVSGFQTPSAFSTAFRREVGLTPRAWQKEH